MDNEKIVEVKAKIYDPGTPQGEIPALKDKLHNLERNQEIFEMKEFEERTKTRVYSSSDYVGCEVGDYSFYFGYEVTECPVESHKNSNDCDEAGCHKREWCFTVDKNNVEIVRWRESEFSYSQANSIELKLILGMAKFLLTRADM